MNKIAFLLFIRIDGYNGNSAFSDNAMGKDPNPISSGDLLPYVPITTKSIPCNATYLNISLSTIPLITDDLHLGIREHDWTENFVDFFLFNFHL